MFPVCYPSPSCSEVNSIQVIYNVQEAMCTSITGNGDDCIDSDDICGEKIPFTLPNVVSSSSTNNSVVVPSSAFGDYTFFWEFPLSTNVPNTLRIGDFDCDGYPDLLIIVKNSTSSSAQLWSSVECTEETCGADAYNANRRTFEHDTDNTAAVENVKNPFAAAFIDFGDDGSLDILISSYPVMNSTAFSITTIENAVDYGTFFLKVTGLSGLCMQWCDDPKFPDPKPIGINQPGAVIKYLWSDNDQDKRVTIGTQLSQSGYLALQTPYVYFGIGDVSHYVQYIYFGVPIQNGVVCVYFFLSIL